MLPKKYRFSPRKIRGFFTKAQSIKTRVGKWLVLSSPLAVGLQQSAVVFAVVIPSTVQLNSVMRHAVTRKLHEMLCALLSKQELVQSIYASQFTNAPQSPNAPQMQLHCAFLFWGNSTRLLSSKQYQEEVCEEMVRGLQNIQ